MTTVTRKVQVGNVVAFRLPFEKNLQSSPVAAIRAYRPVQEDLTLGPEQYLLVLENGEEIPAASAEVYL